MHPLPLSLLYCLFNALQSLAQPWTAIISGGPHAGVKLSLERDPAGQCRAVGFQYGAQHKLMGSDAVVEVQRSESAGEEREIVRIWARFEADAWRAAEGECAGGVAGQDGDGGQSVLPSPTRVDLPSAPHLEVRPLQTSGPSQNRVDLLFLSDGYTEDEKYKFFADAQALVDAIGVGEEEAFGSVRGLVNWWAGFLPSKESGVGTGGKARDTVFGLFRPGTELRGLYYAHPEVARAACTSLGTQCDYPILLGNSPFYGGLGGEFTTITSSILNGPLVLRHELGHSIIDVGEEYDGGGYFGVNAEPSVAQLGWAHWLTDPGHVRAECNAMPLLEYAWTILNSTAPWSTTFTTTGTFPHNLLRFSLSGVPRVTDLIIRLDGHSLPWLPKPDIGMDRWFYDLAEIGGPDGFEEGEHTLEFVLTFVGQEGEAQLCNVEVFEYGSEEEFNTSAGFIGAYPTYSDEPPYDYTGAPKHWNVTSYRPTNEGCLMRQVTTPNFCSVCKEELWMRLLSRVDLIDKVTVSCSARLTRTISLELVPLRGLEIRWEKDGDYVPELEGLTEVEMWDWDSFGTWEITVTLKTPEIRRDEHGFSVATRRMVISRPCPR
ncbi:hypothetical protein CALCODRAFT_500513 [Calocera cornea HHB12733]|uniref:IgA peptidase M64-domain-containing protein n=1 Tax=Calocera cornea HHB12733 TaxID=1353952 RepID=A0A165E2B6_9BASI|nr:hypothetical protein CALCODRAFT_500513 [Calocera cornea HHB12733]